MIKVLVTGAAGFIGSHTVEYLYAKRAKVLALDNFSTGKSENLKSFDGSIEHCDILDFQDLDVVFKRFRPNAVIHLAAQSAITTAWDDPDKDMRVNIEGTVNIIKLCKKYEVRKLVFSSTSAVYGKNGFFAVNEKDGCDPDTPYGVSKMAAEHYIRILCPNHIILRYANVYGPRQIPVGENQLVARALSHFIKSTPFQIVGDGKQKRDFVYVEDIVRANFLAVTATNAKGTFNVASGKSVSVNNVIREIEYALKISYKWKNTSQNDPRGNVYLNGDRFKKVFGWSQSMNLEDGIDATVKWWEKQ